MPDPSSSDTPFRSRRSLAGALVVAALVLAGAGAWAGLRGGDRAEGNLSPAETAVHQVGDRVDEALRWLDRRAKASTDELSRLIEEHQPRTLLAQAAERLNQRLGGFEYRAGDRGEDWQAFAPDQVAEGHSTVLLVHGLDEPGDIWDELAPALAAQGHRVLRFNYPNDQAPPTSADQLGAFLEGPVTEAGIERLSIVAHSMGGLISRDLLTRPYREADWSGPEVVHLITVGTPNRGSPFAAMQPISEARELVARVWTARKLEPSEMLGILVDGSGEAAAALAEGSDYLADLNARPLPEEVRLTIIAGDASAQQKAALRDLAESAPASGIMSENARELLLAQVDRMTNTVGDGVVPVTSTPLDGVEDYVLLTANHRSMLRTLPVFSSDPVPPAIPIISERLTDQLDPVPRNPGPPSPPAE